MVAVKGLKKQTIALLSANSQTPKLPNSKAPQNSYQFQDVTPLGGERKKHNYVKERELSL